MGQIGVFRDMALNGGSDVRRDRLRSWKEIAAFFGTNERTVKRWETSRGLPVQRPPGGAKATVYADVAELQTWLSGAKAPAAEAAKQPRVHKAYLAAGAAALLLILVASVVVNDREPAVAAHHRPSAAVSDLYLKAQYNLERRTPESLDRAVQTFAEAIRRDPLYAEAYVGLANCHLLLREYAHVPDAVAYPRARAAAEKALALDDRLGGAHAALAFVTFFWERRFDAGLAGFRRAIALDPASASVHHWYATALLSAGRSRDALAQIEAAQRLEPQSHAILADKALIMTTTGQTGEARALLREMEAADPQYLSPHVYLGGIALLTGDCRTYVAEQRISARLSGNANLASIAAEAERGCAAAGRQGMLKAILARQKQLYAAGQEHAYGIAGTYALAGDPQAAMDELAISARNAEPDLVYLRADQRFASLARLPAFRRLAQSIGG